MMNCQDENPYLISKAVPIGYQDNEIFVLNIDAMQHRKDLYSDENGSWVMTGCKAKFYTITRDEEGKVAELEKVNTQASSDVMVRRRTYTCSSYTSYHKTIVSIEFGKDIEKWFLMESHQNLQSRSMGIAPLQICLISNRKRAPSKKLQKKPCNAVLRGRCILQERKLVASVRWTASVLSHAT